MVQKKPPSKKGLDDSAMRRSSSPAFARRDEPPMFPPVNRAAMDNDVKKMVALLEKGANIEEPDNDDRATPLVGACRYNNPDTALELIRRGANVNAKTRGTSTALTWAAVNGMAEVGRQLIEKGADMNVPCNGCKTIQELAFRNRDRHGDFYKMVEEAIEARDRRLAAQAQAEAEARAKAYAEGATVLNSPMTVTKPITLKR